MIPHLSPQIAAKVTSMPGVSVVVTDRCAACGTCTEGVCFAGAIHLVDGQSVINDACRGCRNCVSTCPQEAIELSIDGNQFVTDSASRISKLVDLS